MTILIVKLVKELFYDHYTEVCWMIGKAGKDEVVIQFKDPRHFLPKILKTVEYKIIGDWKKTRNGGKKFCVDRCERIKKTTLVKARAYDAHLN